ncbi:MAG: thioredoxin domain-containing protein [Chloroflexi bacterium]|nr:thioredoxin domain-containing protein [Chloroflexota bacterium]
MPNRLIQETSPYLLKHAHNPVAWYPWDAEALQKAKAEDKPIFLSIGYASCHWCTVMEHESFEDAETAQIMNEHFVNIKVDREERPDLDSIYMNAVVAMTGQGGWPMSMFLTPDGKPFYGGTYFPNTRRYNMPAFKDVLNAIATAWNAPRRRAELIGASARVVAAIEPIDLGGDEAPLGPGTLDQAVAQMQSAFDWGEGGWGGAPKFPQPMALEFLMRVYARTREEIILKMLTKTLDKMARGGIYDQLGGGFHRYATDAVWGTPHFERMAYDNAQLARAYLHAWQMTRNDSFRRIAAETLDYVAREMTHARGGFFSSADADSEGHEGKFFVWTPDEIRAALGASPSGRVIVARQSPSDVNDAQMFMDAYGVTAQGNFEGKNILHVARDPDVIAAMYHLDESKVERRLNAARRKLFHARERRVQPARDEKVLTSWNGLMLAAFAEAARALSRDDYRAIAARNADFILAELRDSRGRLHRSWKDGEVRIGGFLEDYANLIEGLLALYQTTFDERWFIAARELADTMLELFSDPRGGFYDTSHEAEQLVTRPKDVQDNAVPSGNAMAATVLLKLGAYTGESRYTKAAERALQLVQKALAVAPLGFAQWLCALDFALGKPKEIAIVGDPQGTRELLNVVYREYRPNQVVAYATEGDASAIPLLRTRVSLKNRATAYVCQNFTCQLPVTEPDALAAQLNG